MNGWFFFFFCCLLNIKHFYTYGSVCPTEYPKIDQEERFRVFKKCNVYAWKYSRGFKSLTHRKVNNHSVFFFFFFNAIYFNLILYITHYLRVHDRNDFNESYETRNSYTGNITVTRIFSTLGYHESHGCLALHSHVSFTNLRRYFPFIISDFCSINQFMFF